LINAKTSKNRSKRQKKKERSKAKASAGDAGSESLATDGDGGRKDTPLKKRRLINGKELLFRHPGAESDEEKEGDLAEQPSPSDEISVVRTSDGKDIPVIQAVELPKLIFHEDD
jgi:hypothetical protein